MFDVDSARLPSKAKAGGLNYGTVSAGGVKLVEEYQAPLSDVFDVSPTVGEQLRRARAEKGLDLADIARDTRIPQRHLAAIEADNHEGLPALTYSIGFVRTFARVVGLSPDDIASQFRSETTKTAHVPQTVSIEPVDEARLPYRGVVVASSLVMAAVVVAVWGWGAGWFQGDPPPPPVDVAAQAEASPEAAAIEPVAQVAAPPPASPDMPVSSTPDAGVPPTAAPLGGDATTGAAQPGLQGQIQASAGAAPVVITASEDAWIKVYDRTQRKTVKMGILAPGETYVVPPGRDDLLLWTGRAGALKITVGGRPVPSLGGPRDTVQDVSLAPAALMARAG